MSDSIRNSQNPFATHDTDRYEIWEMLMRRDFEAFVTGDWSMVEQDFWTEGYCAIDAQKEPDPTQWRLNFPNVTTYRDEWLRQSREFSPVRLQGTSVLQFLYNSCRLEAIEIVGDRAIGCKKFDGVATTTTGEQIVLRFQSLYQMIRRSERWLIAGAVGYLPNPMPAASDAQRSATPW
jgi:hypothetical protein